MNPEGSVPSGRHVVIVTISRLNVNQNIVVGVEGIEPSTRPLSRDRSTSELHAESFLPIGIRSVLDGV